MPGSDSILQRTGDRAARRGRGPPHVKAAPGGLEGGAANVFQRNFGKENKSELVVNTSFIY